MDKKVVLAFALVLLFSILMFVSNVEANHEENSDSTLIVEVFTDKTVYKINETITIHINVMNPTDSLMILGFSSSYQFDYEVRDTYNNLVYRWSDDKVFLMVLTSITISAGDSYVGSFTHAPQDCSLELGNYAITGIVVGYDADATLIEVIREVVPEFPAVLILPLFIILTLITVISSKRRDVPYAGKPCMCDA